MNRACRIGMVAVAGAWASLNSAPARACGGGGVTSQVGVTMNAQRIFMSVRAAGTTDIVAQIAVPRTTAAYGVLIPVPDEPTLDSEPVPAAELDALDKATAPVIESTSEDSGGSGCGCVGMGADDDSAPSKGSNGGVTVTSQTTIGPVLAVALTGDDANAVRTWLSDNGFVLPVADAPTLDRYVGAGRYFIAIRRNDSDLANAGATGVGPATNVPNSIGIHYTLPGDHRMLSLGFTRIGAAPQLAITLFLAAPQAVGPNAPFQALTLTDLDAASLRLNEYAQAVETAVAARSSKAFVLESVKPSASIAAGMPALSRLIDSEARITRATTVLSREKIEDDVIFATPFTETVPSQRFVSLGATRVRFAGVGALALLLTAGALRRRSRARQ